MNATAWEPFLTEAAERYGTPCYVYDLRVLRRQVRALQGALPPVVRIAYALKANANLALAGEIRRLGIGAEISSPGELETVRRAGFDPADVVYTGPAKSDDEIAAAVAWRSGLIVVESAAEGERVARASRRAGRRQPVLLRVNPGPRLARVGIATAEATSKFGVDEPDMVTAARAIARLPDIDLRGIHVSTESNVRSAKQLLDRAEYAVALAGELRAARIDPVVIDLGGGLGVRHRHGETALDLAVYGDGIRLLAARHPRLRFVIEPGRYVVAECGTFVVSVVAVKRAATGTFALADGGTNHLYRPGLTPRGHPPPVLSQASSHETERVTLAGPLMDGDDVLADDVPLPRPAPGDLLAIPACGAYGYSHGLQGFCHRAAPAEVAWDGEQLHLVRERPTPADLLTGQRAL